LQSICYYTSGLIRRATSAGALRVVLSALFYKKPAGGIYWLMGWLAFMCSCPATCGYTRLVDPPRQQQLIRRTYSSAITSFGR